MESQNSPSRDANPIARNDVEHKCASRFAWTVNNNSLAGLPHLPKEIGVGRCHPPELDNMRTSVEVDRISASAGVARLSANAAKAIRRFIRSTRAIVFVPTTSIIPLKPAIHSAEADDT